MARRVQALCGIAHYDDAVSQSHLIGEGYWRNATIHGKQILNKEFAMLTKAILTGGVLSALAGCIVYFGTSGTDALAGESKEDIRIEDTELAGAAEVTVNSSDEDVAVKATDETLDSADEIARSATDAMESVKGDLTTSEVDMAKEDLAMAEEPDVNAAEDRSDEAHKDQLEKKSKPKTKWLDQYLKRTKPNADSQHEEKLAAKKAEMQEKLDAMEAEADAMDEKADAMEAKADVMNNKADAMQAEAESTEADAETEIEVMENKADAMRKRHADRIDRMKKKRIRIKKMKRGAEADAKAEMSKDIASKAEDVEIDIDAIDVEALDLDGDIDVQALKEQLGLDGEENVEIRVIKKMKGKSAHSDRKMKSGSTFDYGPVLAQARKLPVVDMRNQAILEIVDFAVDSQDMTQAADLVQELSTPELRDTARARIGAGFARCGKADAAFAVIDDLEIDDLAAPIRLEIITALMATRQEREAAGIRN